jgi:hypothetical protein
MILASGYCRKMKSNQLCEIHAECRDTEIHLTVKMEGRTLDYVIKGQNHSDYQAFFAELADDIGTRKPHALKAPLGDNSETSQWQPLITEYLNPKSVAGYGDPAVLKTDEGYYLVATSNVQRRSPELDAQGICISRGRGASLDGLRQNGWRFLGTGNGEGWR